MVHKDPRTGGGAAAGASRTRPPPVPFRHAQLPRAMAPRLDGGSTYARDLGPRGHDPASHIAATEVDMTPEATTAELAAGTTRVTRHVPGYTGFQAATGHNAAAAAQSRGERVRPRDDVRAAGRMLAPCVMFDKLSVYNA
jgi:hypothetical protein